MSDVLYTKIHRNMKKIITFSVILLTLISAFGCKTVKPLLPNVSGKAGEVVIVIEKTAWEGDLGIELRKILGGDCPYLAQKEPLFSIANVTPAGFTDMFKVHRNIIIMNINKKVENEGVIYRNNVWASTQCVMQINARDNAEALNIFKENSERITNTLEQAERDRIIANSKLYENIQIAEVVKGIFGGSPHFPIGYVLKKQTEDFVWIANDKQYSIQGVFLYKYPAAKNENFTVKNIIEHRNAFLEKNVPGMFDNTWMTTSNYITPTVEFIRFRGRQFAQTRGFWEVHNDFMGGPFVSHSFYSPDGKDIIVAEAFVYAPKFDKRQYLREVESIIYSFEWDTTANKSTKVKNKE